MMVGSSSPAPDSESDFEGFPLSQTTPASKKRKHDDLEESKTARKKKKSKKSKVDDADTLDIELGVNTAIARFDSRLLADHVAQCTKRFEPDLSLVELEDKHIPEKAFVDTSEWDKPRTLANMPGYLRSYGLGSKSSAAAQTKVATKPGSPHTLVITSAGLRAADATRVLRAFQTKEAVVAKLFAKHIKLKDAIEYVKKTKMGIGVGTPSRIIDLLNADALSSKKLERIVVDASHIDLKKRGILDMKETQQPLMMLLNRADLKDRYDREKGGIGLMFY